MKIAFTGGGTAGHVTPNLALIEELKRDYELIYIGMKNSMEEELISKEGIKFYGINSGKLRRYFDFKNFTDIIKIKLGFFQSLYILKKNKIKLLFSKGGFVSCPVVWAAWFCRIPVIIHESDITPGLANRLSLPFAKHIAFSFPETQNHIDGNKAIFTGLPIRQELFSGNENKGLAFSSLTHGKPIILVTGGSQGSKYINDLIRNNLPELLKKYEICHLCGKGQLNSKLNNVKGYSQFEYINKELKDLFAISDLIISRAGATFIFEILALKKLNILIPLSKKVSRGDQILNAKSFEKSGYSKVVQEEENVNIIKLIDEVFQNKILYTASMEKANLINGNNEVIKIIKKYL